MSVTLPIEIYEVFEKGFGKEDAKKVVKSLEAVIEAESVNKWHQTKNEIIESLVTKDEFRSFRAEAATKADIDILRTELLGKISDLYSKTEKDKAELLGKIERDKAELLGKISDLYSKTEKDKAELLGKLERDKAELLGKLERDKAELLGKIEAEALRLETKMVSLDRKFTIMFMVLLFAIVFLNQNALEFIARVFGLIK